ncbi:hypothetical protein ACFQ3B_06645 [Stackebrandtia endophytica]|uniref:hypothetical protein n=1 Tax=Stackebrandtia endophytica TaxID=1496996 RepID=UPI0014774CDC|nr:hypothetical protein [Stackebrandtia endophytica]
MNEPTDPVDAVTRAEFIDWLAEGGLPDLDDPTVTAEAWRLTSAASPDLRS